MHREREREYNTKICDGKKKTNKIQISRNKKELYN